MQAVQISFKYQKIDNCITRATINSDKDTHYRKNIKHHPYPNKMESNSWSSTCSGNGSSISRNLQEKLLSASHYFLWLIVLKEAFYIMIYEVLEKFMQFLNRDHQLKIVNTRIPSKSSFYLYKTWEENLWQMKHGILAKYTGVFPLCKFINESINSYVKICITNFFHDILTPAYQPLYCTSTWSVQLNFCRISVRWRNWINNREADHDWRFIQFANITNLDKLWICLYRLKLNINNWVTR